jgi:hypothetical protein
MTDARRQRIRRRVAPLLEANIDIRFAFPTSTRVPNRNWFVVVTRDEFVVVRLGWWWLRPRCVAERVPRTLLRPDITSTLKRAVYIANKEYYVPLIHLHEVRAQNDDYIRTSQAQLS